MNKLVTTAATAIIASSATFTASTALRPEPTAIKVCVGKRDTVVSADANGRCPKASRAVQIVRTGPAGAAGEDGAAGSNGQAGAIGADGRDGADGKDAPVPAIELAGATAAAIGDSNTVRNGPWGYANTPYIPQTAWFALASARTGQRVRLASNFAVSGSRSDEMVARQLPQVLALTPRPAVVSVMSGTNDVTQGHTAAEIIASLDTAYDALTSRGIRVIAGTILPSTQWADPAKADVVAEVNAWIKARPGVEVVDFNAALSTETGAPKPGVLMDGTHISTMGAALMGRELAPLLERMFAPVDVLPGEGFNLLAGQAATARENGLDVRVDRGFDAGDRVVAMVQVDTDPAADGTVRQLEATVTAVSGNAIAGAFTDSPGYDGDEVVLTTVPRSGLLMTPVLRVPAGTTGLAVSVRYVGGQVNVGRVVLVKVR